MASKRKDNRPLAFGIVLLGVIGGGVLLDQWINQEKTVAPETRVEGAKEKLETPKLAKPNQTPDVQPNVKLNSFQRHFLAAVELLSAKKYAESLEMFNLATQIRPHVPEVSANMGFAYLGLDRAKEAEKAFEKSLAINSGQTNAYYGLAEALDKQGDIGGALGAMRTYIHLIDKDSPYRRKAMSAVWEWEEMLNRKRLGKDPKLPTDNKSALQ